MRAKTMAAIAPVPALLAIKKILEVLALIPIYTEGVRVAANGGNITAMIGVLLAVPLPMGLIWVVAEG